MLDSLVRFAIISLSTSAVLRRMCASLNSSLVEKLVLSSRTNRP